MVCACVCVCMYLRVYIHTYIHSYICCVLSHFSRVQLFATLWTVVYQAPLFIGFSRQEYWSVFPYPPPRDLPDPGIKPQSPVFPALQVDSLPTATSEKFLQFSYM